MPGIGALYPVRDPQLLDSDNGNLKDLNDI
jgi:hypothetical protein